MCVYMLWWMYIWDTHSSISVHTGMQSCVGESIRAQKRGAHKRQEEKEWKRDLGGGEWVGGWVGGGHNSQLFPPLLVFLHWLLPTRLPHRWNVQVTCVKEGESLSVRFCSVPCFKIPHSSQPLPPLPLHTPLPPRSPASYKSTCTESDLSLRNAIHL